MTFDSICVHDEAPKLTTTPHVLPIYATSSFNFDSIEQGMNIFTGKETGHFYSRYANPTVDAVADKIAKLETFGTDITAKGMLVSSGMAAISTLLMGILKSGDKILTQGNLYGGTTELFNKIFAPMGIEPVYMDLGNLEAVETTLKETPSVRLIYFETPANPTLACLDIAGLASIAQAHNIISVIDNTFCSPYLQQPLALGVDFVIHSTTKYINGHGNSTAGAIVGKDADLMHKVWVAMKLAGTNCSPFEAWLTANGIKTLPLRMTQHCKNAQTVAEFLEAHPSVARVNYPGLPSHPHHALAKKQMKMFGAMLSFELKGGLEAGIDFMNKIKFCTIAPTLGDVDTLILHPASMSHLNIPRAIREAVGITDGLIRLSIGIEDAQDIIADLGQAMA